MTKLSTLEALQCEYSDVHKEEYGVRPHIVGTPQWSDAAWLKERLRVLYERQDAERAYRENEARVKHGMWA